LLLLGLLKKYFPEEAMPLQPLFQYVDRQNLERLQQLAEDITAHGVIRNNEFSKAELIKTGEHHSDALGIVSTAISELHRDASPYESTNPDYDEQFADTHPNTFFVEVDAYGKHLPPAPESSPTIQASSGRQIRGDSLIYFIAGFFINEHITASTNYAGNESPEDIMREMAYGRSEVIGRLKNHIQGEFPDNPLNSEFGRHMKKSAQRYMSEK
tara:strand:- start:396 stop:1034 length:639 start_codon:yes stop_codon:yes gene_type:complete